MDRSLWFNLFGVDSFLSYYKSTGTGADYIRVYDTQQSQSILLPDPTDVDRTVNH